MPLDIYSTRAQLAAIELMPPERSFLFDTFVQELPPAEDDDEMYDYRKGDLEMAPFVHKGTGGVIMGRGDFQTREIGFCTIAPERIIEPDNIQRRSFGEAILGGMTPEQRAQKMLVKDQLEMRQAIQRRREWMVRQVLLTGMLDIFEYTENGRNLESTMVADYKFTNKYVPTKWNQAGANIMKDMEYLFDLVAEGCGAVDIIVMDDNSYHAMLENSKYMALFDMRHVDAGEMKTARKQAGVRYRGVNADGVEIYTVSGSFKDDDGQMKKIIPNGTVIAGARQMFKCGHGPVTQLEGYGDNAMYRTYIKKEVPLRLGSQDDNALKNRITSCPTIVPFNVDAWAIATVL